MKKITSTTLYILLTLLSFGQKEDKQLTQLLQLTAGGSAHGTGDIKGITFNSVYSRLFKQRLSYIVELGGTLHDGSRSLFFTAPDGESIDGSIRYTIGGIQSSFGLGYNILKTPENEVQVKLSALFRYQSSSYYDDVSIFYPAGTGLPVPVIVFNNKTPQRTFAVGGITTVAYNYTPSNLMTFGIQAGVQTDSNGDTITQLLFSIGRRF